MVFADIDAAIAVVNIEINDCNAVYIRLLESMEGGDGDAVE
jgi:hypothetical protein